MLSKTIHGFPECIEGMKYLRPLLMGEHGFPECTDTEGIQLENKILETQYGFPECTEGMGE